MDANGCQWMPKIYFLLIMVIELRGVHFGLKSYAWFQNRMSAQREFHLKSQAWFQTKIARHEVQLPLNYIHFEIAQIQDLVSQNILLMQCWAGLKLNSSIFWGGKSKSWQTVDKSCKICHMILFVFHFSAIWSVTLNKSSHLIGCFIFGAACSLAGKKMRFKGKKWCNLWINRIN